MNDQELKEVISELAFVWGDALPLSEISKILGIRETKALLLAKEMQEEWEEKKFGLLLKIYDQSIQLVTRPEHYAYLSSLFEEKKASRLSNSALETLAIIAYKQPVTRVEIEQIRGVTASSAISTLLKRGLIEEGGRLEQAGRPILYKTTLGFLQTFDLSSIEELPSVDELRKGLSQLMESKNED